MESWQVLKNTLAKVGVKKVAATLKLSQSLVYRWAQPTAESPEDASAGSGVSNPLDRLARLVELTGDPGPVQWLCQQAGGFFVANPTAGRNAHLEVLRETQEMIQDFSDLLDAVGAALADDQAIDTGKESGRIRDAWERLKQIAEHFTVSCEKGCFREQTPPKPPK